jgi:hypothetical protein
MQVLLTVLFSEILSRDIPRSIVSRVDRKSENEKETEVPWDEIKKGYSKEIVLER